MPDASLGPVFRLRLRQPRELGDRAFLKVISLPWKKAVDDSPAAIAKKKFEQMQYVENLV
jgi:hypothetical protein